MKVKKEWKKIQNFVKSSIQKVLNQQKNGIQQQKVLNGIKNKENLVGSIENIKNESVKYAVNNIQQDIVVSQNTVVTTANLKHFEIGESWSEEVYDIMVEDTHEYFANGILVHNCIDAARYLALIKLGKKPKANFGFEFV